MRMINQMTKAMHQTMRAMNQMKRVMNLMMSTTMTITITNNKSLNSQQPTMITKAQMTIIPTIQQNTQLLHSIIITITIHH